MKNIFFAVILLAVFTLQAQERTYQKRNPDLQKQEMASLNPEQRAELHTKNMVLALDLSEAQQKKVEKLNESWEAKRAKMKLTKEERESLSQEERFEHKNARLDEKIAYKREMKQILTDEQYSKFEKMREQKARQGNRKAPKGKGQAFKGKGNGCDNKGQSCCKQGTPERSKG